MEEQEIRDKQIGYADDTIFVIVTLEKKKSVDV